MLRMAIKMDHPTFFSWVFGKRMVGFVGRHGLARMMGLKGRIRGNKEIVGVW